MSALIRDGWALVGRSSKRSLIVKGGDEPLSVEVSSRDAFGLLRLVAAANKGETAADLLAAAEEMAACFDENGQLAETYQDQVSTALEKLDRAIKNAKGGRP